MASILIIFSLLTVAWAASLSKLEHEPQCYSRFDYEYKVVQKLVDLDNSQNEQKGNNAAQLDRIKAIESELEKINTTLVDADREQGETIKELKTTLEEVTKQNEALVAEIEILKDKSGGIKGMYCLVSKCLKFC